MESRATTRGGDNGINGKLSYSWRAAAWDGLSVAKPINQAGRLHLFIMDFPHISSGIFAVRACKGNSEQILCWNSIIMVDVFEAEMTEMKQITFASLAFERKK
ncbi:MAG: hypothetical protein LBI31_06590, partial [Zoogloeaceae bacterium]|nr:hypothetical protein [Zoogloeaceae bacterium]